MKNNKGLTLVALIITIIVLLILAGISIWFVIGENGILTKATTVEETYNKSEVLEELNIIVTQKYLDAYNKATSNGNVDNLDEYYSLEKVIQYLLGHSGGEDGKTYVDGETPDSKVYIESLKNFTNTIEDTRYYVIIERLGRSITKYGKGENDYLTSNDYFYIKVSQNTEENKTAKVFYKSSQSASDSDDEEIGELKLQQNL
ncbi:MAG: hypothetical protein IKM97_02310 [Clostridia bacterium]|nr:hypothetical protein [Clostridia bacterium]